MTAKSLAHNRNKTCINFQSAAAGRATPVRSCEQRVSRYTSQANDDYQLKSIHFAKLQTFVLGRQPFPELSHRPKSLSCSTSKLRASRFPFRTAGGTLRVRRFW